MELPGGRKQVGAALSYVGAAPRRGPHTAGTLAVINRIRMHPRVRLIMRLIGIGTQDLSSFLNNDASKKSNLITQSMLSHEDHTNSMMRTNSNFDTHIAIQSREKYFDKLGLDASTTPVGGGHAHETPKLHSRRLSRGLSTVNLSETPGIALNARLSEVSSSGGNARLSNAGRTSEAGEGLLRGTAQPQSKSGLMMARISKREANAEQVKLAEAAYFLAMSDQTKRIMDELNMSGGTAADSALFKQADAQEGG
jgi:hypothetical protein